jgi:hypothetical protein
VRVQRLNPEQAVLLDIGDGVGALIVYTSRELDGREIEVSQVGATARIHTVVHAREVKGRTIFAGVFPSLPEGDYTLWSDDPTRNRPLTIVSGLVAEVDLRD